MREEVRSFDASARSRSARPSNYRGSPSEHQTARRALDTIKQFFTASDRKRLVGALRITERMRGLFAVTAVACLLVAAAVVPSPPRLALAAAPNGSGTTYHHDPAHSGFDSTQPTAATAST